MPLSKAQTHLYWREWAAVHRADPAADRHALHARALGKPKSSKNFNNADFDAVLAVFRSISQPASVNAQLRQIDQPKTRLINKITGEQARHLKALGVDDPEEFITAIAFDKFGARNLDDLSADPNPRLRKGSSDDIIEDSELEMLRNTVARAISEKRRELEWTEHDLHMAAGTKCGCVSICQKACHVSRGWPLVTTDAPNPF